jgi:hypothetical protein|tara:strand:- start:382 stop:585 length:204 start_codon:yes stop_codon:yes gene_type:complete
MVVLRDNGGLGSKNLFVLCLVYRGEENYDSVPHNPAYSLYITKIGFPPLRVSKVKRTEDHIPDQFAS